MASTGREDMRFAIESPRSVSWPIRRRSSGSGWRPEPFDVAVFGLSDPAGARSIHGFADRGATWWLESLSPMRGSTDELLAAVEAGPPDRF
jgi:hypothetical protein